MSTRLERTDIPVFRQDPIIVLILAIVTCGLYLIYWNLKMSEPVKELSFGRTLAAADYRRGPCRIDRFAGRRKAAWPINPHDAARCADASGSPRRYRAISPPFSFYATAKAASARNATARMRL